jgi:hypothetical protein
LVAVLAASLALVFAELVVSDGEEYEPDVPLDVLLMLLVSLVLGVLVVLFVVPETEFVLLWLGDELVLELVCARAGRESASADIVVTIALVSFIASSWTRKLWRQAQNATS